MKMVNIRTLLAKGSVISTNSFGSGLTEVSVRYFSSIEQAENLQIKIEYNFKSSKYCHLVSEILQ